MESLSADGLRDAKFNFERKPSSELVRHYDNANNLKEPAQPLHSSHPMSPDRHSAYEPLQTAPLPQHYHLKPQQWDQSSPQQQQPSQSQPHPQQQPQQQEQQQQQQQQQQLPHFHLPLQPGELKGAWFVYANPIGMAVWHNYSQTSQCFNMPEVMCHFPHVDIARCCMLPMACTLPPMCAYSIAYVEDHQAVMRKSRKCKKHAVEETTDTSQGEEETRTVEKKVKWKVAERPVHSDPQCKRVKKRKCDQTIKHLKKRKIIRPKEITVCSEKNLKIVQPCATSSEEDIKEVVKDGQISDKEAKTKCPAKSPEQSEEPEGPRQPPCVTPDVPFGIVVSEPFDVKCVVQKEPESQIEKTEDGDKPCADSDSKTLLLACVQQQNTDETRVGESNIEDLNSSDSPMSEDDVTLERTYSSVSPGGSTSLYKKEPECNIKVISTGEDEISLQSSPSCNQMLRSRERVCVSVSETIWYSHSGTLTDSKCSSLIDVTETKPSGWWEKIKEVLGRVCKVMDAEDSERCECFRQQDMTNDDSVDFCPCCYCCQRRTASTQTYASPKAQEDIDNVQICTTNDVGFCSIPPGVDSDKHMEYYLVQDKAFNICRLSVDCWNSTTTTDSEHCGDYNENEKNTDRGFANLYDVPFQDQIDSEWRRDSDENQQITDEQTNCNERHQVNMGDNECDQMQAEEEEQRSRDDIKMLNLE